MFKSKWLALFLSAFLISSLAWATSGANMTETPGQFLGDTAITTAVKSELLANQDIKSLSISVATDKGVVTLTGTVNNDTQKKEAISIASHVNGVKSVKDELVVGTK